MAVIHISEEKAGQSLSDLIAKVRAGETVHIDSASDSFAIVPVEEPKTWTVDEAIRRSKAHGIHAMLDDDFADEMEEIMRKNRLPRQGEPWESS